MLVELWKITMLLMGKSTINGHFQVRKLLVYQAGYHFKDAHIGVHISQSHEFPTATHPPSGGQSVAEKSPMNRDNLRGTSSITCIGFHL